jgi:hypothetical protein
LFECPPRLRRSESKGFDQQSSVPQGTALFQTQNTKQVAFGVAVGAAARKHVDAAGDVVIQLGQTLRELSPAAQLGLYLTLYRRRDAAIGGTFVPCNSDAA